MRSIRLGLTPLTTWPFPGSARASRAVSGALAANFLRRCGPREVRDGEAPSPAREARALPGVGNQRRPCRPQKLEVGDEGGERIIEFGHEAIMRTQLPRFLGRHRGGFGMCDACR